MATQTHCLICKSSLRGGGNWCFTCPGYMHVKCSGLARSSDHYDDFSCHRCTSQFHSANDKHECNPPTLATTTLPQMHPHPSTTPHSQNTGESSTIEPRAIQDPWSNPCSELIETTRKIYTEVVHWKPVFMILSKNKVAYNFIETLKRTLNSLIENNENTFAMHAAMIFPHLLLCKTKSEIDGSFSKTIARRLKQWQDGDLDGLYNEGKALQMRLLKGSRRKTETEAQQFNKLMSTGKISSAIAKLTDTSKGVLSLDEIVKGKTVEQTLIEKHPQSKPIDENYITPVSDETIPFHPSIFDQINGQHIKKAAMRTHGSHGPSGLDANEWRRILTHFGQQSVEISKTIAKIAKKLATEELDPELMEPYNACRLIPLDKNPGVRPIGIGEVMRRIIGRTITKCLKTNSCRSVQTTNSA